ncbi:twin-arginine translocase TatA/TatE family subunit [Pseudoclavibacter sp. CFCC 13796]|uniref:twin-arginine translocase TatA/TatE family subunit n=1 Tax=Pseudoclavibacter sp. CFCC 13796 TaxID=2615179 RepID=UPI001CE48EB0|nr:twin-arginine translocase TatA/TatE family subunit [Pseudoclavibacter sp. CFCC 13796]
MTFEKLLLLAFVAVLIMGPKNLPRYAQWLGETVRKFRAQWRTTKSDLKDELGVDGSNVDWRQLDPRQYDPRRIIREALRETPRPAAPAIPSKPEPPQARPSADTATPDAQTTVAPAAQHPPASA